MQFSRQTRVDCRTRPWRPDRVWHNGRTQTLAALLVTGAYILPSALPAWAQTVTPNVDVHLESPRPVELLGRPEGSKGWASICQSPCDQPVPLTWTYEVQNADYTTSTTFQLKPTSDEAHVLVRPANPTRVGGGVLLAVLGGLVGASGYALMQIGSERLGCPGITGASPGQGCDAAPYQGDTLPGTLMLFTGVLTAVVGAVLAIDGATTHASQVQ